MDFLAKILENGEMSRFQTGQQKPKGSGRRKGIPNRKTLILSEALGQLGCDLPTEIIKLLPKLSPEKQVDVYLQLMQYVYPKRKAIELTAEVSTNNPQVIVNLPFNARELAYSSERVPEIISQLKQLCDTSPTLASECRKIFEGVNKDLV